MAFIGTERFSTTHDVTIRDFEKMDSTTRDSIDTEGTSYDTIEKDSGRMGLIENDKTVEGLIFMVFILMEHHLIYTDTTKRDMIETDSEEIDSIAKDSGGMGLIENGAIKIDSTVTVSEKMASTVTSGRQPRPYLIQIDMIKKGLTRKAMTYMAWIEMAIKEYESRCNFI